MLVLDNLKERRPTKLINTRDISSNHVNAEVKVDGTITDNRIAREKEKSCAKVVKTGMIILYVLLILLIYQILIMNY